MATVPTYVILGGGPSINGGEVVSRAPTEPSTGALQGGLHGLYRAWPKFAQSVPSDPTTGLPPVSPAYAPYWDTAFGGGVGAWVVYHHANGIVVPGAKGDNHYEFGGGITPTTMLMQMLKEKHASAPYFKVVKLAVDGGVGVGASPMKSSGFTLLAAQFDTAAAAAVGDTLDVQVVVLDASLPDIIAANLSYESDLQTAINNIRGKWGDDCLIVLVSHHRDVMKTSLPPSSPFARDINRKLAAANENVVVFDYNWAKFAPASIVTYAAEAADPKYYDTETYIQAGVRLFNTIEAWRVGDATPGTTAGLATVVMLTDSQGKTVDPWFTVYSTQGSLLGAVGGTVRAGEFIWNKQTQEVELYDSTANACTMPDVPTDTGRVGPEVTALTDLHAVATSGVCVFKFALNGAALTTEAVAAGATGAYEDAAADLLDDVRTQWANFCAAVQSQLGRQVDCIGVLTVVGDNDKVNESAGNAFAEKLPTWIDDLRDVFTTRSFGDPLPIVALQPPKHLGEGGDSVHGTLAGAQAVRAAVADLPSQRANVAVLQSNATRYELSRVDHIHYGGEAILSIGRDFAEALLDLIGRPATVLTADPESEDLPATTTPTAGAASEIIGQVETAMRDQAGLAGYTANGRTVQYRSAADMIALHEFAERQALRNSRRIRSARVKFQ